RVRAGPHPATVARLHRWPDFRLETIRTERLQRSGRFRFIGITPHEFGATAVVLKEEYEGIVETIVLLELRNDAPDALVHAINHRRIDFHATGVPLLVLGFRPVLSGGRELSLGVEQ